METASGHHHVPPGFLWILEPLVDLNTIFHGGDSEGKVACFDRAPSLHDGPPLKVWIVYPIHTQCQDFISKIQDEREESFAAYW